MVRQSHRGVIVHDASHALAEWNPYLSAHSGWTAGQIGFGLACALILATAGARAPWATLAAVSLGFSVMFLAMVLVRLTATAWSFGPATQVSGRRGDETLPIYTVVVPLYREGRIVPQLVAALTRIDYPPGKLDIRIVVEEADRPTITALEKQGLPDRFHIIFAPAGMPQTKPRALNVALRLARGRYLVVFDAEDIPEPGQLRMAVDAFEHGDPRVECLQARLAIQIHNDSWLERLFALEYAALFDVINPGLATLGLPIALGGTSNHFRVDTLRRLNGWDAWNVTEDVDLGIRLARFGYRVGMLASSTREEAPHRLTSWLGQRRRWQKGWMITLQTHSRDLDRLFGELGAVGTIVVFAILGGTVMSSLLGPFFVVGVVLDAIFGSLLTPHRAWEFAGSFFTGCVVVSGLAGLFWPLALGMHRRELGAFAKDLLLMPVYLLLISVATWQAVFEVFWKPYAWTKTEHGIAIKRRPPLG